MTWTRKGAVKVLDAEPPVHEHDRYWIRSPRLPPLPPPPSSTTTHALCPDCGCLLKTPAEFCPSCLVWAERDAIRGSWIHADRRWKETT